MNGRLLQKQISLNEIFIEFYEKIGEFFVILRYFVVVMRYPF